jgi:hypothetical protein
VAEWLRSGLQIRALRFDSGRGLQLPQNCSGITFAAHLARRPRLALQALWSAYIHVRHINGDQLMDEYRNARLAMIDSQLRPSGVAEARLLRAFAEVPREKFVSENRRAVAYVCSLSAGRDGSSSRLPISGAWRSWPRLSLVTVFSI